MKTEKKAKKKKHASSDEESDYDDKPKKKKMKKEKVCLNVCRNFVRGLLIMKVFFLHDYFRSTK